MRSYFALLALSMVGVASASAVNVSYTVSGTSGAYVLDFSVNNNILAGQNLYFFGVKTSGPGITGSPSGYNPSAWPTWNNTGYGGSATVYNNNWIDYDNSNLAYGSTLSGFQVTVADLSAPTSIEWFAYGLSFSGANYDGPEGFNHGINPGFEGVATQAVPEPMSMAVLSLGAVALLKRRRK